MEKIRRIGIPARIMLVLGGLVVIAHIAATLAFTGPQTPLKASLQPALNKYFLGPLDQGWSLFAPGPYSQDEYFLMRACLSPIEVCAGGVAAGAEFSEWRNITEEEQAASAGNILANRSAKQSKTIHGRYWTAAHDLSDKQRQEIASNHIQGQTVFGVELDSAEAKKKFTNSQLDDLRAYERMEKVAVGFATLYAKNRWGDSVSMVEVQMRRDPVTPFAERHDPAGKQSQIFTKIGWRDALAFDEEVLAAWK
ncbi:DUF5819 family protein [Paeniglutamicibacter sp. NPDC091659]|uniref:DUF5819 family protein n=1 Tax=Paeniglutamicibacter sp. NPDC091659 TaxID=3364389 RepID=UPI0038282AAC